MKLNRRQFLGLLGLGALACKKDEMQFAQHGILGASKSSAPFGTFLHDNFNRGSLGSDWVVSGTANWNLDGSDLTTDGGGGVIDRRIRYAGPSNDRGNSFENFYMEARIQLLSTPSSSTIGIALMLADFAVPDGRRDILGQLYMSTSATLGGKAIIQTYDGTTNVVRAQSSTALTRTNGEWYLVRLTRSNTSGLNNYHVYAKRELDNSEVTTSWDEPLSYPQSAFGNSTGQFAISSLGGTIKIDYVHIYVHDLKNVRAVFVGDSKTHGAYSTNISTRFASNVFPAGQFSVSAGSGDVTQRVLDKIQNLIEYNADSYFMMIGGNDIRNAVSTATWQANLDSIRSALKTALPSTQIYWVEYPEETALDISAVNTYVQAKISDNTYLGDIWIPCPINTATDLVGDGVHPDQSGHDTIAANIIAGI